MAANTYSLDGTTDALLEAIHAVEAEISWSEKAIKTFDLIQTAYGLFNNLELPPDYAVNLLKKIKELERLLTLDLERHMALRNGRDPYYFVRMDKPLQRMLDTVLSLEGESFPARDFDHLSAEIQSAFVEYGLCSSVETIHNEDEATVKMDALSAKLDKVEKVLNEENIDVSLSLVQLHQVIADLNGIRQSMTEETIQRLQKRFTNFDDRIVRLENNLSSGNMKPDSKLFMQYLAGQHLLKRPVVDSLMNTESIGVINGHMIHPGTRGWILERFRRMLDNDETRVFCLAGKHGCGKTALSSAVCKLSHSAVASHFFDVSRGKGSPSNSINGLIQGIAYDMCHSIPEYLNYLDDKFQNGDMKTKLARNWKDAYEILLKDPIQALFGIGRSATPQVVRKLIVIDALDECRQDEWGDLKTFFENLIRDTPPAFCFFLAARNKYSNALFPNCVPGALETIRFEDRAWANRHIKDIEIYLSSSLGAILSGEDEKESPRHAKADIMTLQNSIDELLKSSAGRFDYAMELMETFAREMSQSGQFLGSLKKATMPIRQQQGNLFEQKMGEFASPYRAYRDKEGRSVDIRVMRQSHFLKDKTRVALIRGRHRIQESAQNGE